jgi:SAM-dependent methyltransferase
MNILDWGCGRGRTVLWLKTQGYNAFGTDIDPIPIQNGIELFISKGYDNSILKLLSSEGKTDFPDNFFDFIISDQVFEHVSNLESVAAENRRILKKEGVGLHIYPAHKYIVEGHLFMPFIHWLLKNFLRKGLIAAFVLIGKEPHWTEVNNLSIKEKTKVYYQYSINKTFYRNYTSVKKTFENEGFDVKFVTIDDQKFINHNFFGKFTKIIQLKPILNILLLNFVSVKLFITKK